jgi:hypothetical protein
MKSDWIDDRSPWECTPFRKDWTAERAVAQTRARVTLECVHHDPVKGGKVYKVRFRRFCFGDYRRSQLSIYENPASLTFRLTKAKEQQWRFLVSFKHGRLAFYQVTALAAGSSIKRAIPTSQLFDVTEPIKEAGAYPVAIGRFHARLIALIRAKARANGLRLPKPAEGCRVATYLMDCLYPARRDFTAQLTTAGLNDFQISARMNQRYVLPALRGPTAEVVKRATGYSSKAVSKLFWSRMAEDGWSSRVGWAAVLRTYLPVDYTQQLLAAPKVAEFNGQTWNERAAVTRLLKTFTPKRLMGILQEPQNGTLIRDAGAAYTVLWQAGWLLPVPREFKTIEDLHDHLVRERRKLKERDFPLKIEWAEKVDGAEVLGYRLVCPTSAFQMKDWGEQMSNCIGGYAANVASGHTRILGLIQDERCHFGIEISRGAVRQFRGRFNADAPADLRAAVENLLVDAKLIELDPSVEHVYRDDGPDEGQPELVVAGVDEDQTPF